MASTCRELGREAAVNTLCRVLCVLHGPSGHLVPSLLLKEGLLRYLVTVWCANLVECHNLLNTMAGSSATSPTILSSRLPPAAEKDCKSNAAAPCGSDMGAGAAGGSCDGANGSGGGGGGGGQKASSKGASMRVNVIVDTCPRPDAKHKVIPRAFGVPCQHAPAHFAPARLRWQEAMERRGGQRRWCARDERRVHGTQK